MRKAPTAAALLASIALLACESDNPPGAEAAATAGAAPAADADSIDVRPYESPPGFPLPFQTAVPEGIRAEPEPGGSGMGVDFTWEALGEEADSAYMYVRVMPEGTSEGRAREIVRTAAERVRIPGDRSELDPTSIHHWAVVEYPIRSQGRLGEPIQGWVALGQREGHWYYVITRAPEHAWEPFSRRTDVILDRWRWEDAEQTGIGAP